MARRLVTGAGGVLLIVSLFLPWAEAEGVSQNGRELLTIADGFLLITGLVAIAAAITGGRIGVFRPDVSLTGAADLLAVVATVLLVWHLAFGFPDSLDRGIGAFLALIGALAIAAGAGDYRPVRGEASLFPRLP